MIPIKKIVIIGPESTGKSSLCEQLSEHYQTAWVKEYAREYLLQHGTDYNFDNLLDIAQGQARLEDTALSTLDEKYSAASEDQYNKRLLFIDTDMHVLKVWCEFVFDRCHRWILDQVVARKYDLFLLCNIDLPWVKDELREYPDLETREKLYHHYKDIMINQHIPWVNISGNYAERLQKAIAAIDRMA